MEQGLYVMLMYMVVIAGIWALSTLTGERCYRCNNKMKQVAVIKGKRVYRCPVCGEARRIKL